MTFVNPPSDLILHAVLFNVYLQKGKHHVVNKLLIRKTLPITYLYDLLQKGFKGHAYQVYIYLDIYNRLPHVDFGFESFPV